MDVQYLDPAPPNADLGVAGTRIGPSGSAPVKWHLAEEAAIGFLINGQTLAVMMATPSDLEDFALGFLFTEKIITHPADLTGLRIMPLDDGVSINCIVPGVTGEAMEKRRRTLTGRSGCGICGAETLGAALRRLPSVTGALPNSGAILAALNSLPTLQPLNARNHSTHAAGFFGYNGTPVLVREDVGRHNALDKLIGALLRSDTKPGSGFIVISSRMSVEMVQKAAIFGVAFLASVSAPTNLALRTARAVGLGVAAQAGDGVVVFGDCPDE